MTRFGTIGAACLALALAASSPALARGGHGFGGGIRSRPSRPASLPAR